MGAVLRGDCVTAAHSFNGHHPKEGREETWLTPRYILDALGPFDLDPCCPPNMPWQTAATMFTKEDDGLAQPWFGRVWCNPPYDRDAVQWMRKLAQHGCGTALVFARTETRWFVETVWNAADAIFFFHQRLTFCHSDGRPAKANGGAPSVLAAYGADDVNRLQKCGLDGTFLRLERPAWW